MMLDRPLLTVTTVLVLLHMGCSCSCGGEARPEETDGGGDAGGEQDAGFRDAGADAGSDAGQDAGPGDFVTTLGESIDCPTEWVPSALPPTATAPTPELAWMWNPLDQRELADIGGALGSAPTLAPDGTAYVVVGTLLDSVAALDTDGAFRWVHRPDRGVQIQNALAAPDSRVIVARANGYVTSYSIDGEAGPVRYIGAEELGRQGALLATGPRGRVYVATRRNIEALCADSLGGAARWRVRTPSDFVIQQMVVEGDGSVLLVQHASGVRDAVVRVRYDGSVERLGALGFDEADGYFGGIRLWGDRMLVSAVAGESPNQRLKYHVLEPSREPWVVPGASIAWARLDATGAVWVSSSSEGIARYVDRSLAWTRDPLPFHTAWVLGDEGSLVIGGGSRITRVRPTGEVAWRLDLVHPETNEPLSLRIGWSMNLDRRGVLYSSAREQVVAPRLDVTAPDPSVCPDEFCNFTRNRSVARQW
jgi:hypothetical protein